jgi:hypothetical protein
MRLVLICSIPKHTFETEERAEHLLFVAEGFWKAPITRSITMQVDYLGSIAGVQTKPAET